MPQVQQAVVNLILNARQAMTAAGAGGGLLTFTLTDDAAGGTAELAVRDTGPGIPRDVLPRIFEPFYSTKADAPADGTESRGGTGLGLPLVKDVLEAHGGRVRVESAPGRGSCFTLKFPRVG